LVGLGTKTVQAVLNTEQSARPGQRNSSANVDAVIQSGTGSEALQAADWRDR
jgi:hypothetical protein